MEQEVVSMSRRQDVVGGRGRQVRWRQVGGGSRIHDQLTEPQGSSLIRGQPREMKEEMRGRKTRQRGGDIVR